MEQRQTERWNKDRQRDRTKTNREIEQRQTERWNKDRQRDGTKTDREKFGDQFPYGATS